MAVVRGWRYASGHAIDADSTLRRVSEDWKLGAVSTGTAGCRRDAAMSDSNHAKLLQRIVALERKVDEAVTLVRATCGTDSGAVNAVLMRLTNAERQIDTARAEINRLTDRVAVLERQP